MIFALPSVYLCLPDIYILVIFGHHLVFSQNPKLIFHIVSLDKTPHVSLVYHYKKLWLHCQAHGSYADFARHKHQVAGHLAFFGLVPGTEKAVAFRGTEKNGAHGAHGALGRGELSPHLS